MAQPPSSLSEKIRNSLRIDRAFGLVWKAGRRWTVLSILLTVCSGFLPLVSLYLLKLIIDSITRAIGAGTGTTEMSGILTLIAAATGVALLQAALNQWLKHVREVQTAVVTDYIAATLHRQSIDLDLAYYENPVYYDTLHRAQQEGLYRPTSIVGGLTRLLQNIVSLAAMVGLLFAFHWGVGLLLFISTVPGVVVQIIQARKRYAWKRKRTPEERRAGYLGFVLTQENYAKEIRLFDLGDYFSTAFNAIRTLLRKEKLELSRSLCLQEFFAQSFAALVLMGSLLLIVYRTLTGAITVGDMVMYFQAFQRGVGYLKELLQSISSLYEDNLFISYFFEFLDISNKIRDPASPLPLPEKFCEPIRLEKVGFSYPGERKPVLEDVSLSIGPGEVVALVGANGAGKSTLVKLLCRLYDPDRGKISIEGEPLASYKVRDLRRRISVVFQDFARYYLTVRENIMLGDVTGDQDDARIREAALKADADGFINRLPQGYETVLGRLFFSGEELSLGEWQKIVLARAFLRESPLIILDEPTSSMDVHTEYHLYNKFRQLVAGRSALIISHRFSTVRMADRIYVLENGRICEAGTHEELVGLGGVYAGMYLKSKLGSE